MQKLDVNFSVTVTIGLYRQQSLVNIMPHSVKLILVRRVDILVMRSLSLK